MRKNLLSAFAAFSILALLPQAASAQGYPPATAGSGRAWLGVALDNLTPASRQQYRFPFRYGGVLVRTVVPRSPAALAGVTSGDVIMRMNGRYVYTPQDVISIVGSMRAGATLSLDVYRYGAWKHMRAQLTQRPLPTKRPTPAPGWSPPVRRWPPSGPGSTPGRGPGWAVAMKLLKHIKALREEVARLREEVSRLRGACRPGAATPKPHRRKPPTTPPPARRDDGSSSVPPPAPGGYSL